MHARHAHAESTLTRLHALSSSIMPWPQSARGAGTERAAVRKGQLGDAGATLGRAGVRTLVASVETVFLSAGAAPALMPSASAWHRRSQQERDEDHVGGHAGERDDHRSEIPRDAHGTTPASRGASRRPRRRVGPRPGGRTHAHAEQRRHTHTHEYAANEIQRRARGERTRGGGVGPRGMWVGSRGARAAARARWVGGGDGRPRRRRTEISTPPTPPTPLTTPPTPPPTPPTPPTPPWPSCVPLMKPPFPPTACICTRTRGEASGSHAGMGHGR